MAHSFSRKALGYRVDELSTSELLLLDDLTELFGVLFTLIGSELRAEGLSAAGTECEELDEVVLASWEGVVWEGMRCNVRRRRMWSLCLHCVIIHTSYLCER